MILNSIELQNFRQYKKTIKKYFCNNNDKNITLIVAANGVGKGPLFYRHLDIVFMEKLTYRHRC